MGIPHFQSSHLFHDSLVEFPFFYAEIHITWLVNFHVQHLNFGWRNPPFLHLCHRTDILVVSKWSIVDIVDILISLILVTVYEKFISLSSYWLYTYDIHWYSKWLLLQHPFYWCWKQERIPPLFSPPLLGPRDFEPRVLGCPPSASPARTTNSPESKDLAVEKVVLMHWDITWILTGIGIWWDITWDTWYNLKNILNYIIVYRYPLVN